MLLVTGASGFVGRNLVKKLVAGRTKVRCLVRDKKKIDENERLEVVEGSVLDKGILDSATQGVDAVIHLAAVIKSSDPREFADVNVQGTRNLVEACVNNKVRRIIYVSSLDAGLNGAGIYGRTKAGGEDIVKNSGVDYVILRPSFIYGKGAKDLVTLMKLIARCPVVPVVGHGEGKLQPVHVDDVCDVIVRLLESGARSKTYYIAGEQKISLNDLIDKVANLTSKRVVKIHIPLWVLWLPLKLYGLIVRNSSISYESLSLLNRDKTCEIADIERDLGFKPRSLDDGLRLVLQS